MRGHIIWLQIWVGMSKEKHQLPLIILNIVANSCHDPNFPRTANYFGFLIKGLTISGWSS